MIRDVDLKDTQEICDIYNYYVENTIITFEEELVSSSHMEEKIVKTLETHPWIVYEEKGKVVAYAYASPWRVKSAYRFSAELTVYVDKNYTGKGFGSLLYSRLLELMAEKGIHCVYGVVTIPNEGSNRLHKKLGFSQCAHCHEVGFKFNKWIDVAYWEKILSV
jgi:phosphinothricin acetyltransferase